MKASWNASVVATAVLASLLWAALVVTVAEVKFGGDPRGLLFLGRELHHPAAMDGIPRCGPYGYDGQFYAALATDPFLRSPETVKALDAPGYRASRILLPMLAWCAGAGSARAALVAYQALCWTFGVLAVVLASAWARREEGPAWWGVLLVANAGLVTAMLRSTHDGAAVSLVLATLWLAGQGRDGRALGSASAAALCRETGYVAPLAVALRQVVERNYRRAICYALVPVVPQLAWQGYLQVTLHPTFRFPTSVSVPAVALVGRLAAIGAEKPVLLSQEFWGTLGVLLTLLAGVAVAFGKDRLQPQRLAFIAFATLAVFLSSSAYADVYGFSRHLMAAPFLAVVLAAREENRWVRALLLSAPAAFSIAGFLMIAGELEPLIGPL